MPSCFGFPQFLHFLEFSQSTEADKWPDVSQLAYSAGNRSNLTWIPTMGMPTCLQNLRKCKKCPRPCLMEGVRWGQKAPCDSTLFLDILETTKNNCMALYDQIKALCQAVLVFGKILHLMEFSRSKKTNKWPDVSQVTYGLGDHSNLTWMPSMGTPTCL